MKTLLKNQVLITLSLVVSLTACGGGGNPNTQAPTAVISFPPAVSMTDGDTVTVHGTAGDDGTIAFVRVNGVDVFTNDGYATWFATVPLVPGTNALTVGTSDTQSNGDAQAAEAMIERQARLIDPRRIALDTAANRAWVVDSGLDAVIAVDLTTGARTVLSDVTTPDGNNPFTSPEGIAFDTANDRILVVDRGFQSVVVLHPASGERVDFSR